MREQQPDVNKRSEEIRDYFRELYPADNELGFDPHRLEISAEERQIAIDRREKLDKEQAKSGRKLRV